MTEPTDAAPSAPDTAEQEAESLKRKARLGVIALGLRTVVVQLTVLGGNVFLYRLLNPEDFGAFAIVQFALAFFAYFGDAGLGAALIQKKDEPTRIELSSVWYLQIFLSLMVVAAVGGFAPQIIRFWPDMPESGAWLLQALSLNLLFTALRVIPAILMERHLQFGRLAILEVLLNVSFYVTATVLALMGMRVKALVGAVLVQGALGAIAVFIMRPWRPALAFDRKALAPMLRFGVYFQSKNLLAFVTSAISPVYGGRMLGQYGVGLLTWAQNTAFFPLQIVSIVSRITFPLYARMQSNKKLFVDALGQSVQLTCIVTLALVALFLGLGPNLVHVVFTDKWAPALPLFYIYCLGISIGFLSPIVATALDATGRASTTLRITIFNSILIWVLVPIGTHFYGAIGFASAYAAVMWIGNFVMIVVLRRLVPGAQLWRRVRGAVLATVVTVAFARFAVHPWANGWVTLVLGIAAVLVAYMLTMLVLDPAGMRTTWRTIVRREKPVVPDTPAPAPTPHDSTPVKLARIEQPTVESNG